MEEENNDQLSLIKNETLPAPVARNESEGLQGIVARDAHHLALRNTVKVAVMKAYLSLGKTATKEDLTFLINELHSEILRVFPGIRLEEVGLAIHKTAMGEFIPIDKIYIPSLSVFVTGIRMYMVSEQRINAAKSYMSGLLLEEKTKPTDKEIAKMKRQNVLNAYEFYKQHGYYNDYGNAIFDCLVEYGGIIDLDEEKKNQIWKGARSNVFKSLTSSSRTMDERAEKRKKLVEIKADKHHSMFYTEAKKIALNVVFKELAEMKMDLKDMIS